MSTIQTNQEDNQEEQTQQTQAPAENTEEEKKESVGIQSIREAYNKLKAEHQKVLSEREKEQEAKLEEQGKYKELLELEQAKRAELEAKMTKSERIAKIESTLRKSGASDEVIDLLSDNLLSNHDWDSDTTLEQTIAKVKEQRPTLFTTVKSGSLGAGKTSKGNEDIDNLPYDQYIKIKKQ